MGEEKEIDKIYEVTGLNKTSISSYLISKKLRTDKKRLDGIRLKIVSENGLFQIDVKDFEAMAIISALSDALFMKKCNQFEKRNKSIGIQK